MEIKQKTIVVALGGNALQRNGETSVASQQTVARETARQLVSLIKMGYKIVIVHGNGPQVGDIVLREHTTNTPQSPMTPLDTCGAMSQGEIGYWLQQALQNELAAQNVERNVATVVTQALVDANDAAFQNPSKPIGPFYPDEQTANIVAREQNFVIKEDAGRGWRRVVASPLPMDIIEKGFIQDALDAGSVIIAAGGGGIPVIKRGNELVGVEAVIDKDRSAAKLAELVGADTLLILTTVDAVTINYRQPNEMPLHNVTVQELQQYSDAGQFAPGSMLPKVEAAIEFAMMRQGNTTIITSPAMAVSALTGEAGTRVLE
jgi:carbamate kinase